MKAFWCCANTQSQFDIFFAHERYQIVLLAPRSERQFPSSSELSTQEGKFSAYTRFIWNHNNNNAPEVRFLCCRRAASVLLCCLFAVTRARCFHKRCSIPRNCSSHTGQLNNHLHSAMISFSLRLWSNSPACRGGVNCPSQIEQDPADYWICRMALHRCIILLNKKKTVVCTDSQRTQKAADT